jgi:hypothetical protein
MVVVVVLLILLDALQSLQSPLPEVEISTSLCLYQRNIIRQPHKAVSRPHFLVCSVPCPSPVPQRPRKISRQTTDAVIES